VAEQNRASELHKEWLRGYDARCERDRLYRVELNKRIADLVAGTGEFMRRV
jgi:hypothetical protein